MKKIFLKIANDYNDKPNLVSEVIGNLYKSHKNLIINAILDRENISPTILDMNIGVPHIVYDGLKEESIIFALLKNPIYWGKNHAETVDKVFFILAKSRESLNTVLSKLAIFIQTKIGNINEKDYNLFKI